MLNQLKKLTLFSLLWSAVLFYSSPLSEVRVISVLTFIYPRLYCELVENDWSFFFRPSNLFATCSSDTVHRRNLLGCSTVLRRYSREMMKMMLTIFVSAVTRWCIYIILVIFFIRRLSFFENVCLLLFK